MYLLFIVALAAVPGDARAGAVEIGASANYRATAFDAANYARALSYTGSLTAYVGEHAAVEANFTTGYSKSWVGGLAAGATPELLEDDLAMTILDAVWSPAAPGATLRPYLKLGAGYLTKTRYFQPPDQPRQLVARDHGFVPSAGAGLSLGLTQALSVKAGIEAWTSAPLGPRATVDYAARGGLGYRF